MPKAHSEPSSPPPTDPSGPYPPKITNRRSSGQPKSNRQQFAACGACRMRRVRCDLKDLIAANPGVRTIACSNCQERDLNCVDEFAEMKAVKLLRRGRRLQQVEAVYGRSGEEGQTSVLQTFTQPRSIIPKLKPEFFSKPFFQCLHIQRPILEPYEFVYRFQQAMNGPSENFGLAGQLICNVLMAWATSFGVDEYGNEDHRHSPALVRQRRKRANEMVEEILTIIDAHGLLRKPSWDGVRALMLFMPLTEDVLNPADRKLMAETITNHAYLLCTQDSENHGPTDLVRMLVYNYAYTLESVVCALPGSRCLLSPTELQLFQSTLPSLTTPPNSKEEIAYSFAQRYSKAPLKVAAVCRHIHDALSGTRAQLECRIDGPQIEQCWIGLEHAYAELESTRHFSAGHFVKPENVDRFVNSWQIILFGCYNAIRMALGSRLGRGNVGYGDQGVYSPQHLYEEARNKCWEYSREVVNILRRCLNSTLFKFDASLIRDKVIEVGLFLAGETGWNDDVELCIRALSEMHWAFARSDEAQDRIRSECQKKMLGSATGALGDSLVRTVSSHDSGSFHFVGLDRLGPTAPLSSAALTQGTLDYRSGPSRADDDLTNASYWSRPSTSGGEGLVPSPTQSHFIREASHSGRSPTNSSTTVGSPQFAYQEVEQLSRGPLVSCLSGKVVEERTSPGGVRLGRNGLSGPDAHIAGEGAMLGGEAGALVTNPEVLFYSSQVPDMDHHYGYPDQGGHSGGTKDLLGSTIPRTLAAGSGGSALQLGFSDSPYFHGSGVFSSNAPSLRAAEATAAFASF